MTTPLKEALVALTDALAKRPAEEILFQWFRSGRLIGELSNMMKRRHPEVQARDRSRLSGASSEARKKDCCDDRAGQRAQLMPLKLRPSGLRFGIDKDLPPTRLLRLWNVGRSGGPGSEHREALLRGKT
jgi:hypothetical protein